MARTPFAYGSLSRTLDRLIVLDPTTRERSEYVDIPEVPEPEEQPDPLVIEAWNRYPAPPQVPGEDPLLWVWNVLECRKQREQWYQLPEEAREVLRKRERPFFKLILQFSHLNSESYHETYQDARACARGMAHKSKYSCWPVHAAHIVAPCGRVHRNLSPT